VPALVRIRDKLARHWVRANVQLSQIWRSLGEAERASLALQRSQPDTTQLDDIASANR
jgi:hypothetical protein